MAKGFARRGWYRYSKLGKGRKKKMKWRAPLGRHGKMREKRKGADKTVSIGYGNKNRQESKIIMNMNDLNRGNKKVLLSSKLGRKKKLEIAKRANEMGIEILNFKEILEAKK